MTGTASPRRGLQARLARRPGVQGVRLHSARSRQRDARDAQDSTSWLLVAAETIRRTGDVRTRGRESQGQLNAGRQTCHHGSVAYQSPVIVQNSSEVLQVVVLGGL